MVASLGGWTVPTVVYATGRDFEDTTPGPALLDVMGAALAEARLARAFLQGPPAGADRAGEGRVTAAPHRCDWADSSETMRRYHDDEWGVPSHDERHLFEMLILEGAQAGLSWSTILNKRENYRRAFAGFDPRRVSRFGDDKIARLLEDPGIVRNRLKVRGTVTNARAVLAIEDEHGSFDAYLWAWVDGQAGGQPAPIDGRRSGPFRTVGPPVQGPQTARAHLRRVDHRLLLPAVGGGRRRPSGHLPEQAVEETGPVRLDRSRLRGPDGPSRARRAGHPAPPPRGRCGARLFRGGRPARWSFPSTRSSRRNRPTCNG